jgi:hypothetical protein
MRVRIFLVLLAAAGLAGAQSTSHPSWWTYASPDSTALIGIQWNHLRESPFAARLETELSPKGWLGFPDLAFLNQHAERILIASPYLMAIHFGSFPADVVRSEAAEKGLKKSVYKNVELWVTPAKETLSLAWISEQIVILGHLPTLQDAIDRSLDTEARRQFSPLFARAGKYSGDDLWVVSGPLPDPVVGRFVPLKIPAASFEGSMILKDGSHLAATLEAASEKAADGSADQVWHAIDPKLFQSTQVFVDGQNVLLKMDLTEEQLAAAVKLPAPPPVAVVEVAPPPARPQGPRVVKISGLEDGPREIAVP